MITWKNDFYFFGKKIGGTSKPASDAVKFVISYPKDFEKILAFDLEQVIRWFDVKEWKSVESENKNLSSQELRSEGNVHALIAFDITNEKKYSLKVIGREPHKYLQAKVYAPWLKEKERESIDSKVTSQPLKTLESLAKYLTCIAGLRNNNLFLRGAAVYNPKDGEVILLPGANGRQRGKSLALLHLLSKGYEPLANSHIWLKFSNDRVYIYPQRMGEQLPVRVTKSNYYGEFSNHDLDIESIEDAREKIGATSLDANIGEATSPKDLMLYFNTPKDRICLKIPTKKLLVLWPDDLNLASGELHLVPRQKEDILQNLRKSWQWNKEQIIQFCGRFIANRVKEKKFIRTLDNYIDSLPLNKYLAPIVKTNQEISDKDAPLFDVFKPEHYREAHGTPVNLLSQLHGIVYKKAANSLEDRLGAPINNYIKELNERLTNGYKPWKISGITVKYYNSYNIHKLFYDGIRPEEDDIKSKTIRFKPMNAIDIVKDNIIESIFRDLASQNDARRILELRFVDNHNSPIGIYKLANFDGIYRPLSVINES